MYSTKFHDHDSTLGKYFSDCRYYKRKCSYSDINPDVKYVGYEEKIDGWRKSGRSSDAGQVMIT